MLRELDALLPDDHKTSKPSKTAGFKRACGSSGRSLENVLGDVNAFIKIKNQGLGRGRGTQAESQASPARGAASSAVDIDEGDNMIIQEKQKLISAGKEAGEDNARAAADRTVLSGGDVRAGLLSSRTLFVAELRLSDFATLALSPGALDFLALSPWAEAWERKAQEEDCEEPRGAGQGDWHPGPDVSAVGAGADAVSRRRASYYHLSCITNPEDTPKLLALAVRAQQLSPALQLGPHGAYGGSSSDFAGVTLRLARFVREREREREREIY